MNDTSAKVDPNDRMNVTSIRHSDAAMTRNEEDDNDDDDDNNDTSDSVATAVNSNDVMLADTSAEVNSRARRMNDSRPAQRCRIKSMDEDATMGGDDAI